MTAKTSKIMWATFLVTCLAIIAFPLVTLGKGEGRVLLIDNKCGLEVELPKKTVDLGNLNPGESKESNIKFSNKGSNDITLYIKTNILKETSENGGYLSEIMKLTISEGSKLIADDSLGSIAEDGNLLVGIIRPGTSKILDMATYLPGYETGNKYQGAYMKVNWTFVTQCAANEERQEEEASGSIGGFINEISEEIMIEDDPVPLGIGDSTLPDEPIVEYEDLDLEDPLPDPEATIIIGDDMIPAGFLQMPKTGQLTSLYYYGIGSLIMMLGIYLKKNK